jgi:hypothetical protein
VLALVEGPSERNFVRFCLGPYLGERKVDIVARVVGKPSRKGGVRPFQPVRDEILGLLRQHKQRTVTTMFDYFRLHKDWPGLSDAKKKSGPARVLHIEAKIGEQIVKGMGKSFDPGRFVPYIQLHEFEALVFSDTDVLSHILLNPSLKTVLDKIVEDCGGPEDIDDGPATAPSKRIEELRPAYNKPSDGPDAAILIGVEKIRQSCPHFDAWLGSLEALVV